MLREPPFGSVRGLERGRRFEPEAGSVRAARAFVADALADQGFQGDSAVVLLLASELATNAVRHAATPFEILVEVQDHGVRVEVVDGAVDRTPEVRNPGPDETNGRGLLLVDQLAAGWGSDRTTGGKSVWFQVQ